MTKCRGVKYDGPERFSHDRCITGITATSPTRSIPAPGIIWKTWDGDGDGGGGVGEVVVINNYTRKGLRVNSP